MKRDIQLYINDILDNCNLIKEYTKRITEEQFKNNI